MDTDTSDHQWHAPSGTHELPAPAGGVRTERLSNPYALFGAAVAIALAAGLAVGMLVGWAAASSAAESCAPYDGWCGLGAALAGLLFGGVAGIVTYVASGVIIIVKCRRRRNRAKHVIAHLAFPFAAVAILTALQPVFP